LLPSSNLPTSAITALPRWGYSPARRIPDNRTQTKSFIPKMKSKEKNRHYYKKFHRSIISSKNTHFGWLLLAGF